MESLENQPARMAAGLRRAGIDADFLATSDGWGAQKPTPAFFERLANECGVAPAAIAYVGDRIDNDVVPAVTAGMVAVHLRRGPWGVIQCRWPEVGQATLRIDALDELRGRLAELRADGR